MIGGISMEENNQENITVEKWVNLEDIAEYLSVSKDTIRIWLRDGKLPIRRAGKRYKFKISEVDEWLREGKMAD
ncbi:helix-turn-helix domain-containing protein [Lactococcus formosensis]|uniref:helix-turn-helix domain-containing protein n=2 Tax=Lactococcus TaxID=1357 RepID=UPI00243492E0|nr:helix-turn-helix domain-containing protein [Lactococcus formosensis]MDG6143162.1 helix-turn-helix domain-containing protein [Lactococcus formosensis]